MTNPIAAPTPAPIPNVFAPGDFKNPIAAFFTFASGPLCASSSASFCAEPTGSFLIASAQVDAIPPVLLNILPQAADPVEFLLLQLLTYKFV